MVRIRPARHYQCKNEPVRLVAENAKPGIRRDMHASLKMLSGMVPDSAVELARAGLWYRLKDEIAWGHFQEVLKAPFSRIGKTFEAGAALGIRKINGSFAAKRRVVRFGKAVGSDLDPIFDKALGDRFNFDVYTPPTQDIIRAEQDRLIGDLTAQARDSIDAAIMFGARNGFSPEEIVADIRNVIGLSEQLANAAMNYENALRGLDATALQRQLRDTEMDVAVRDAMSAGVPLSEDQIQSLTGSYIDNALDYRAAMIAQTESVRAASLGLQDAYQQAVDRGAVPEDAVTLNWQVALDERTCFPAGVLVDRGQGTTPIQSLRAGDFVTTRAGQRRVVGVLARPSSKTMIVLRGSGGFALSATWDHPVFCRGGWLDAVEVKPGDTLYGVADKPIKIATVAHIEFADAHGAPALSGQDLIASGVLGGVAMPVGAVDLNGDLLVEQRKVYGISPDLVFLLKRNAPCEGGAHGYLWQCFAVEPAVAAERAKLASSVARESPERLAALPAFADYSRAATRFGAVFPTAPIVLHKNGAATLAWNAPRFCQTATAGADVVSVGVGPRDAEILAALLARLLDPFRGRTLKRAVFAAARDLGRRCVEVLAAFAGHRPSRVTAGLHFALGLLIGSAHSLSLKFLDEIECHNSVMVYDIEVAGEHEFFANGVLVHNCPVCLSIPDMNPDGIAMGEQFDSIDGPVDLPPVHPNCRCSVEYVTNLDMVPSDAFA